MGKCMADIECAVYKFIVDFITENGYSPSYAEIGKAVGCVKSVVMDRIRMLELLGKIKMKRGCPRTISVVGYEFVKKK